MSSHLTSRNTEAVILARLIQIEQQELSRGAAEYLLSIRLGDRDTARMNELSELARQGKLTSDAKPNSTATLTREPSRGRAVQRAALQGSSQ
jgi:hypothetical protein